MMVEQAVGPEQHRGRLWGFHDPRVVTEAVSMGADRISTGTSASHDWVLLGEECSRDCGTFAGPGARPPHLKRALHARYGSVVIGHVSYAF